MPHDGSYHVLGLVDVADERVYGADEQCRIEVSECGPHLAFGLLGNILTGQESLCWGLGGVVALTKSGADSVLADELTRRLEVVLIEDQEVVDAFEDLELLSGFEPSVGEPAASYPLRLGQAHDISVYSSSVYLSCS